MASTNKYCIDCAFFRLSNHVGDAAIKFGRCVNPAAVLEPKTERYLSPDLDTQPDHEYASSFRAHGICGPAAALFAAKEEQVAA